MFNVKYNGTSLSDSEEVDMWKDVNGHLEKQKEDRQINAVIKTVIPALKCLPLNMKHSVT